MANFGGHAIPGSFFLLFGLWLTVKHILHHFWRGNQPKGRMIRPPFLKRMDYFEGGFATFASFVGQFCSQSICTHLQLLKTCSWLISFGLMLSHPRHYGWTVCGGWTTCPPLWQRGQFMGEADELAAQHHVSVLWDLWNSVDCLYCIQTGTSRLWPPHSLHCSICWR